MTDSVQAQLEAVLRGIEERTPHAAHCNTVAHLRRRRVERWETADGVLWDAACLCDRPERVRAEQARTVERMGNAIIDELWMAPSDPSATGYAEVWAAALRAGEDQKETT